MDTLKNALGPIAKALVPLVALAIAAGAHELGLDLEALDIDPDEVAQAIALAVLIWATPNIAKRGKG